MKLIIAIIALSSSAKALSAYESGPSFKEQVEEARLDSKELKSVPYYYDDDLFPCDFWEEDTCYDPTTWNVTGCVKWEDGGCPCPDGETKCGEGWDSYCSATGICCDIWTEEFCYDADGNVDSCAAIADGGCPCTEPDEVKCGGDGVYWAGYCTTLCCADDQETCWNWDTYEPEECKAIADGGCDCPDGQVKCGGDDVTWAGYCTDLCCPDDSETCYDYTTWEATECKPYADGGCPCPEGEEKCGSFEGWPGYCTKMCCDEMTCYDDNWEPTSCATYADGCPEETNTAFDVIKNATPQNLGSAKHAMYEANKLREKKMLAHKMAKKRAANELSRKEEAEFIKIMKRVN